MTRETKAKILAVDDRPENLLTLAAILEPLDEDLVTATSGEEALRHLLHDEFAVILLDVQMPGLDGFETARYIKEREKTRHIPIIFLTAISKDAENVARGYSAGAVDYVMKPFEPAILRSKVTVFVELYEKNRQLARQAELLREKELAELRRASEERYRFLAESIPQQVWTAAPDGGLDYVNQRVLDYFERSAEEIIGWGWAEVLHPDDLPVSLARWQRSLETGEPYEVEFRLRRSDGRYRWHLARALALTNADGAVVKWFGTNTEIEDQKRIEAGQQFLAEASEALGRSLDYRRTLATVARLAVPRIADWCAVDMVEEDGSLRLLEVAHVDGAKVKLARELRERYPPDAAALAGPTNVVRTGESELVPEIPDAMLASVAADDLHLDLLRALGLTSYMCVPLVARGRTLGAVTFALADAGRLYGADDLALAEELARRASTAVDNAQLYAEAEERAQAARVLASVGDGVFLLDRRGVVRLWNPAAAAITGLPEEEVLGRRAASVLSGWADVAARVPVASAPGPAGSPPETVPLEIGGRERWLSMSGVAVDEGTVYAFRDLTEERAVEQMKSDFVATVSHELRTPLAAIYGAAVTLQRTDVTLGDDLRAQLLQILSGESERLTSIVEDILLASHLDSGRLQLAVQSCDPVELAESVLESAGTHLPAGISLALTAPKDAPAVAVDAGQLRQVLANLVDNAIKYSPDGGPVEVTIEPAGGNVRLAVRDEGLGIPPGEQGRIFDKFYRLDPQMQRGIGGTGLGLYICRELVRRMNGDIWVESDGGGSTFFVEVPAASAADGSGSGRRAQPARAR